MPNRLADAASPYLRQHADNPVDWWPWSDAAFEEAARRDVPVFLSIGYATCHWCHVMAHRSFEDTDVAEVLNRTFVCVKLDREERPDVDAVYMAACQMVTGRGGWPLTVVTTPDRRPFFVGTYLPPRREHGRAGVIDLAAAMSEAWKTRRDDVLAAAGDLTAMLDARFAPPPDDGAAVRPLGRHTLDAAVATLRAQFDAEHGGFGRAPKFPSPHILAFLLRRFRRTGGAGLLPMVTTTLDAMQRSGIHDRVGGGFHRYATDRAWRLPHFEKMLYDQAGLLGVYAEAAALTGRVDFAETATGIVGYVERDLPLPSGLIAAAEDADSLAADGPHAGHMHEGAFYTWTPAQLVEALGEEDGLMIARLFGVTEAGNIWDEASGAETGESLLVTTAPIRDLAPSGADPDAFARRIDGLLDRLRIARDARPRPLRDDKALADWNGWWLATRARAASLPAAAGQGALLLGDLDMSRDALRESVRADLDRADDLFSGDERLAHRVVSGHDSLPAVADDYAFLAAAHLAALADRPAHHLARAAALADRLIEDHWDEARGLFTTARRGTADLIASPAERYDGAMPSANSVALDVVQRLARLTGRDDYDRITRRMWEAAAAEIGAHPSGFCHALLALDDAVEGTREIVVAVRGDVGGNDLLDAAHALAGPDDVVLRITDADRALLVGIAPPLAAYAPPPDGHASGAWAYVCQNFHCEAPVETVEALRALLSDS